jgi:hypothetical protein
MTKKLKPDEMIVVLDRYKRLGASVLSGTRRTVTQEERAG